MFYDRFIELCETHGVSPALVAKSIGLSNSATTYWKRGSTPKAETLQKIADYFNISVNFFYDCDKINSAASTDSYPDIQDQIKIRLYYYLNKLNAAGQQVAVDRVEELTEIPKYRK